MYNCTVKECIHSWIDLGLSIPSVVTCVVAIAVMIYYKFYCSFNYRLILYLLISFLIKAIGTSTLYTLHFFFEGDLSQNQAINFTINFIYWYVIWNIQLCIAFMTAEIFSMVIFSVELRKAEIPLTLACFILPLIGSIVGKYVPKSMLYEGILETTVAGVCSVVIAIILFCLAY